MAPGAGGLDPAETNTSKVDYLGIDGKLNPFPGFPLFSAPICMENTFFVVFHE